jgi:ketosteroid isomerase-like protein
MNDTTQESKQVVEQFWMTMQTNDFWRVGELPHDDYILEWPQSGERIRGRANFIAVNENYPAQGRWEFTVHQIVAEGDRVVSDVDVTDGVARGRVITFSTVREGRILHQAEFWPDPDEAPQWRAQWVERL